MGKSGVEEKYKWVVSTQIPDYLTVYVSHIYSGIFESVLRVRNWTKV